MTRVLALAVALAFLAASPLAAAAESRDVPRMPDDVLALTDEWSAEDRARLDAYGNVTWRSDVETLITRASALKEDGRFRSAFTQHLSARVSMAYHALKDDLDAYESPDQERARVLAYGDVEVARAEDAFAAFRADLHALDGNLTSLRAQEVALYAASIGMRAVHSIDSYSAYRREVAEGSGAVDAGLVLGVVDTTHGARVTLALATDLLRVAEAREGLAPGVNATAYANFTRTLESIPQDPNPQPHMAVFVRVMEDAAQKDEHLLMIAAWSAGVRAEAVVSEQFKFQDAAGRDVPAMHDLRENVNATLAQPLVEAWTERGFDGLAARDAIDNAWATKDGSRQDVAAYVHAWIDLVHANFTASTFSAWSPVTPPAPDADVAGGGAAGRGTPAPGAGVLVLAFAALALVARGRAR